MQDLHDRRAFIVGGSSGIGRAAAGLFVARGAGVVLGGRDSQRLAQAVSGLGPAARALPLDVTDPAQIAQAVADLPEGGVDYLVITAATLAHGPFAEQPLAEARAMFESKFWGAYALVQACLPRMRDGGAVVLISGVLSRRPGRNCVALGAACAALEGLTRGLALELGPRLRVNCIAPGMVRSELHEHHPPERREAIFASTGASLPVGRVGRPCEIAEAVLLAATNGYMTGHVLDADGGHCLRQYAAA